MKEHLTFIINLIKEKEPNLIIYEDTNYIHWKTKDGLSLLRLLSNIESLSFFFALKIETMNVLKVKEMTKKLLNETEKLESLSYEIGRSKGWMWKGKRISIHQLKSYLVYYLFKNKK